MCCKFQRGTLSEVVAVCQVLNWMVFSILKYIPYDAYAWLMINYDTAQQVYVDGPVALRDDMIVYTWTWNDGSIIFCKAQTRTRSCIGFDELAYLRSRVTKLKFEMSWPAVWACLLPKYHVELQWCGREFCVLIWLYLVQAYCIECKMEIPNMYLFSVQ